MKGRKTKTSGLRGCPLSSLCSAPEGHAGACFAENSRFAEFERGRREGFEVGFAAGKSNAAGLLEALENFLKTSLGMPKAYQSPLAEEMARAAISKAKGEQS